MTTQPKDRLRRLVDELPESSTGPAVQLLEYLRDEPARVLEFLRDAEHQALRALDSAPLDDEPTTEADRNALIQGREQFRRRKGALLPRP